MSLQKEKKTFWIIQSVAVKVCGLVTLCWKKITEHSHTCKKFPLLHTTRQQTLSWKNSRGTVHMWKLHQRLALKQRFVATCERKGGFCLNYFFIALCGNFFYHFRTLWWHFLCFFLLFFVGNRFEFEFLPTRFPLRLKCLI